MVPRAVPPFLSDFAAPVSAPAAQEDFAAAVLIATPTAAAKIVPYSVLIFLVTFLFHEHYTPQHHAAQSILLDRGMRTSSQ